MGFFRLPVFLWQISMAIKSIIPLKILESITFGNCSRNTNPSWTFLSNDSENIAISFLADECGSIVETEPNVIYQTTLFIPNSGNFFSKLPCNLSINRTSSWWLKDASVNCVIRGCKVQPGTYRSLNHRFWFVGPKSGLLIFTT